MRARALLLALLVAPAVASPAYAGGDECPVAAQGEVPLPEDGWSDAPSAVAACAEDLPSPSRELLGVASYGARRLDARDCGVASAITSAKVAPIHVARQIPWLAHNDVEQDEGPAVATYTLEGDVTTYSVRGEKWGLDVVGARPGRPANGTLHVHGVPLPVVAVMTSPALIGTGTASAASGCTAETAGSLCRAAASATLNLAQSLVITVESAFNVC